MTRSSAATTSGPAATSPRPSCASASTTSLPASNRITRIGFIDSETIGCVASKVELYLSLVFIIGVVAIKFFMAVLFGWFLSWRLGNYANETYEQRMKRAAEIEQWSDDIYRPAPAGYRPNARKHKSFLPTQSRFSVADPLSLKSGSRAPMPLSEKRMTRVARLGVASPWAARRWARLRSLEAEAPPRWRPRATTRAVRRCLAALAKAPWVSAPSLCTTLFLSPGPTTDLSASSSPTRSASSPPTPSPSRACALRSTVSPRPTTPTATSCSSSSPMVSSRALARTSPRPTSVSP